jgi:hypothetical protein
VRVYPLWIEKIVFVLLSSISVWALWTQSDLTGYQLWLSLCCGLPFFGLIITEAVGRMVQLVHISRAAK